MAGNDFSVLNQAFPATTTPAPPPSRLQQMKQTVYGIGANIKKGFNAAVDKLKLPGAEAIDPNNPLKGLGMGQAQGSELKDRRDVQLQKQMGEIP